MTTKNSCYFAATITHLDCNGKEWQEIITRANLKGLQAIVAKLLTHDDDMDEIIRAEIHDRTYTKEEAKQLRLMGEMF